MSLTISRLFELLRHQGRGNSINQTAKATKLSTSTVKKYFDRLEQANLTLELAKAMTIEELREFLLPRKRRLQDYCEPDWEEILHEYRGHKVPLKVLWQRYVQAAGDRPLLSYPSFCRNYRLFAEHLPVRLSEINAAFDWPPGEVVMIDYSGDPLYLQQEDVHRIAVQVFVSVMPYSNYTFAFATPKQTRNDWLDALIELMSFLDGVPEYIYLDNSTSLVTRADAHNPQVCKEFQSFCDYYGITPYPVSPGKPRHKGAVEGAVRLVQERCTRPLAARTFFTLEALNAALLSLCNKHNEALFSEKWRLTRQARFAEEKPHLQPLPAVAYEKSVEIKILKVRKDCLIRYRDRRYSVPFGYIGRKVRVLVFPFAYKLKIYSLEGELLAEHSLRVEQRTNIKLEHFPENLRAVYLSNTERRNRLAQAGPNAAVVADALLKLPQRVATKQLSGLLSHLNHMGAIKLEEVCALLVRRKTITYDAFSRGCDELYATGNKRHRLLGKNVTLEIASSTENIRGAAYFTHRSRHHD